MVVCQLLFNAPIESRINSYVKMWSGQLHVIRHKMPSKIQIKMKPTKMNRTADYTYRSAIKVEHSIK